LLVSPETRVILASPHRYADLARLWHRFVRRQLQPAFARLGVQFEINIFCDGGAADFTSDHFPGVVFSTPGPGMRDFIEFYDAALKRPCEFLFFVDADVFFLDGDWLTSYFEAFRDPSVAAVSFVPRKGKPAIFALLCRADAYRELPKPVFACRYEFPEIWPNGSNLQLGDFAARELSRRGKRIINVDAVESSKHLAIFHSTTGVRTTREHITRASGAAAFYEFLAQSPHCIAAAYENVLLGGVYEWLFAEPFAPDASGAPLSGSGTLSELAAALSKMRDPRQLEKLVRKFRASERVISQIATRDGLDVLPDVIPALAAQR
jgi:hypothetical protein